ncbi:hypothetical protein Esti_002012 [Eimeria stiedai]
MKVEASAASKSEARASGGRTVGEREAEGLFPSAAFSGKKQGAPLKHEEGASRQEGTGSLRLTAQEQAARREASRETAAISPIADQGVVEPSRIREESTTPGEALTDVCLKVWHQVLPLSIPVQRFLPIAVLSMASGLFALRGAPSKASPLSAETARKEKEGQACIAFECGQPCSQDREGPPKGGPAPPPAKPANRPEGAPSAEAPPRPTAAAPPAAAATAAAAAAAAGAAGGGRGRRRRKAEGLSLVATRHLPERDSRIAATLLNQFVFECEKLGWIAHSPRAVFPSGKRVQSGGKPAATAAAPAEAEAATGEKSTTSPAADRRRKRRRPLSPAAAAAARPAAAAAGISSGKERGRPAERRTYNHTFSPFPTAEHPPSPMPRAPPPTDSGRPRRHAADRAAAAIAAAAAPTYGSFLVIDVPTLGAGGEGAPGGPPKGPLAPAARARQRRSSKGNKGGTEAATEGPRDRVENATEQESDFEPVASKEPSGTETLEPVEVHFRGETEGETKRGEEKGRGTAEAAAAAGAGGAAEKHQLSESVETVEPATENVLHEQAVAVVELDAP